MIVSHARCPRRAAVCCSGLHGSFVRIQSKIDENSFTPTFLDHSLVAYGSSMSNGRQHDHDPLPVVVVGGLSDN